MPTHLVHTCDRCNTSQEMADPYQGPEGWSRVDLGHTGSLLCVGCTTELLGAVLPPAPDIDDRPLDDPAVDDVVATLVKHWPEAAHTRLPELVRHIMQAGESIFALPPSPSPEQVRTLQARWTQAGDAVQAMLDELEAALV